jgi:hypothetical protein
MIDDHVPAIMVTSSNHCPKIHMATENLFAAPLEEENLSAEIVDDEDTSSSIFNSKPWNPAKIRITTKNFSLREVVDQIRDDDIDLSPDFQREYVWKRRQRTRLVESILLGIPLPAFYFNQDDDGTYQVVDGVQRLSTIHLFMEDGHVLEANDLEYLKDLDGLKFSELDPAALRRFRSAQIVVHVIEPQTPDEVKYDIFGRVNTLGSPLSTQEIRHAMSKSRSRNFLKDLSEMSEFDLATGQNFWIRNPEIPGKFLRDTGRMMNRELVLRFCAFKNFSSEEYRSYPSLDSYLVEFTRRLDGRSERAAHITDHDLFEMKQEFQRAMVNASTILGKAAFRRWPLNVTRRGPINRAVFESQALALAGYRLEDLLPKQEQILTSFRKLFEESEYARSVTVGTGDPRRVETRLVRAKDMLQEIFP